MLQMVETNEWILYSVMKFRENLFAKCRSYYVTDSTLKINNKGLLLSRIRKGFCITRVICI